MMNIHFTKEDMWTASRSMKRWSTEVNPREKQIVNKTKVPGWRPRAHMWLILGRGGPSNRRYSLWNFHGLLWKCQMFQPRWKTVWTFLVKLNVPYHMAQWFVFPHKDFYRNSHCTLFIIAPKWERPSCVSTGPCVNQSRSIHTRGCCPARGQLLGVMVTV